MTTPRSAASYDTIPDYGALYDSVPAYGARGDTAFYTQLATNAGGPVLELGCGTGRILLSIARAGVPITGIDGSAEMLARLVVRLATEPADVRDRVVLHLGDASNFDLGTTFSLVIAPFRVLQHLTTLDEQLGCVRSVARHLAPGGQFVFDVFNPYFGMMVKDRSMEAEDTAAFTLPDGRTFRRMSRVPRVDFTEQLSEIELIYYLTNPGASEPQRFVQRFDMRWYVRAELVHLLARAGLTVRDVRGNFDGSVLTDASPEQVVFAVKDT
ncbi:MAG: class I SAM-dependent methyltransferase [Gemmatimonadaceae bacterium]